MRANYFVDIAKPFFFIGAAVLAALGEVDWWIVVLFFFYSFKIEYTF